MIDVMEDGNRGVVHYSITLEEDVDKLPKNGIRTGSSATLYLTDGFIMIWNFIANENSSGSWVLMK